MSDRIFVFEMNELIDVGQSMEARACTHTLSGLSSLSVCGAAVPSARLGMEGAPCGPRGDSEVPHTPVEGCRKTTAASRWSASPTNAAHTNLNVS